MTEPKKMDTDEIIKRLKEAPVTLTPNEPHWTELTKDEAYAIAEFIDMNIFEAIRNDDDWDSFMALRSLVHGYEKCCTISGYVGLTDSDEQSTIDGDAR